MSGKTIFTLSKLNKSIDNLINSINTSFWIKAEIAQIQYNSGHAYLELIEKKEGIIVAKNRATIWSSELMIFKHRLKSIFGDVLNQGSQVLVEVSIKYHAIYGLSLQIEDLDESYSIGEFERLRKETIEKLTKLGVFQKQGLLPLAIVPQKIAVISSKEAAGFEDFVNQINHNSKDYKFFIHLFPTIVQGQTASENIIKALKKVNVNDFDVIVIIRGGGSKTDLYAFDNFELALLIAEIKCPILTGIGHERDETISDMVAFKKFKTPTAVANFLVSRVEHFEVGIDKQINAIKNEINFTVQYLKSELKVHISNTIPGFNKKIVQEKYKIDKTFSVIENKINQNVTFEKYKISQKENQVKRISLKSNFEKLNYLWSTIEARINSIKKETQLKLSLIETNILSKDPEELLLKGFTMTLKEGKLINAEDIKKGDEIETHTNSKIIYSVVDKIEKKL